MSFFFQIFNFSTFPRLLQTSRLSTTHYSTSDSLISHQIHRSLRANVLSFFPILNCSTFPGLLQTFIVPHISSHSVLPRHIVQSQILQSLTKFILPSVQRIRVPSSLSLTVPPSRVSFRLPVSRTFRFVKSFHDTLYLMPVSLISHQIHPSSRANDLSFFFQIFNFSTFRCLFQSP